MQAEHGTIDTMGPARRPVEGLGGATATRRVPGAVGMVLATAGTLGGLYGALALAVHPG